LQRAGELEKAAAHFDTALQLNPDNVVAQINLQFNKTLRAGGTAAMDLSKATTDRFSDYRSWSDILNANGPFDEPSFTFESGDILAGGNGYFRQAVASFERVRQLDPANLPARLWLGRIYLMSSLPQRALEVLREPLAQPEKFSLVETNETQLRLLAAAAYLQETNYARGAELLNAEMALHPDNNELFAVIDRKLKAAPDDLDWLYSRGYVFIQLKNYDAAIAALSRVLAVQTNNDNARFNRAIANLDSGHLDAARADYLRLQQSFTNAFQVAYGLGEIAWRQHETNEAVRNYKIYLGANANTNSDEFQTVRERYRELKK
jgi:tetratricopeptide (TPR) repeat protein